MKLVVYVYFSLLFFIGCNGKGNLYKLNIKDAKLVEKEILILEKLIVKIPSAPHYENSYPEYTIDVKGRMIITYSNLQYESKDSIVEDRYNPNVQIIDTLENIEGLTTDELYELKKSINYLKNEDIIKNEYLFNEFIIRDHSNQIIKKYDCPFFVYPYNVKDWMMENPEKTGYIVVLNKKQLESECFTENFIIKDKKDNIYLIIKK